MNLLDFFKEFLITRDQAPSKVTVKNYVADVRKFIAWIESTYHTSFNPSTITQSMITRYKEEKLARIRRGGRQSATAFSASSVDRYMSSLRKFFSCLKDNGITSTSPFDLPNEAKSAQLSDTWFLKRFKNDLYINNNSPLTIKNYIIDVRQFLEWAEQVTKSQHTSYIVDRRSLFQKIDSGLIEEYKYRLLNEGHLSPVSINRKLSGLRRYFSWAYEEKLLDHMPTVSSNLSDTKQKVSEEINIQGAILPSSLQTSNTQTQFAEEEPEKERTYSKIPPIRLAQKSIRALSVLFDTGLIVPLALASENLQYLAWILTGKKLFSRHLGKVLESVPVAERHPVMADPLAKILGTIPNFKKSFYAPYNLSTTGMPLHKKALHHIRHTRPKWYRKYHAYPLVHYIHFAILIIFMSAVGFGLYRSYWLNPHERSQVLAAKASPPRVLSFQGRLTDSKDNPITANTNLRFGIYNSQTATGSALLWQEIQNVTPDQDGIFSVLLGKNTTIPQSLFGDNAALFLGITIGRDSELIPRQQIATVAYATNAELLQGMPAITQANAGTTNVILALDSAGNLTIGGTASPTFQATGGTFTLSGKMLNLTTTVGSNGNVVINPDGTGTIDMQKPLQNSANGNNIAGISGAVEVDDTLAILASNGQPALAIDQTSTGPIITASQAGVTKFRVANDGLGYFAAGLGINEVNPNSKFYVNSGSDAVTASFSTSATTATLFSFLTNGAQYASLNKNINADLELNTLNNVDLLFTPSGNIGIGTTIPGAFKVQVAGHIGPNTDSQYDLGSSTNKFKTLYVNQVFTADTGIAGYVQRVTGAIAPTNIADDLLIGGSSTGSAKIVLSGTSGNIATAGTITAGSLITANAGLTVASGQNFTLAGLATPGGLLYTNGSGVAAQTATGNAGQCLLSAAGASPVWGPCITGDGINYWTMNGGALYTVNTSSDLLIGGNATTSAKFAFINVSQGTPTASISGNIVLNSTGSVQTTQNQTLTLGGSTTGTIDFKPGAASTATMTLLGNGNVGIGTTAPVGKLTIAGTTNQKALAVINGDGNQDLFTASASGTTKFAIKNNGNVDINAASVFQQNVSGLADLNVWGSGDGNQYAAISLGQANATNYWYLSGPRQGGTFTNGLILGYTNDDVNFYNPIIIEPLAHESLFIKANNSIGIGTTTPNHLLHVNGIVGNNAAMAVNQTGSIGDIFTASSSGTTRFVINNSGNVGIGTSTPGALYSSILDVESTSTSTATGYQTMSRNQLNLTPSSNLAFMDTRTAALSQITIPASNTRSLGWVLGLDGSAENYGTGAISRFLTGTSGWAANYNGGAVASMSGMWAGAEADAGTVTTMAGLHVWTGVGGATVTNSVGIEIEDVTRWAGTLTNRYGIRINALTGTATNDYGLYQAGAAQQNYFAGNVGIGTSSATAKLTVRGSQVGALVDAYNTTTTAVGSVLGMYANATSTHSTGTTSYINGIEADGINLGAGNVSVMMGVSGYAEQSGAGTVDHMASFWAWRNIRNAGTVNNNYGLYIEEQVGIGTNNYQLYSTGTAPSYFGGNIGIGTTAPVGKLNIAGTTNQKALALITGDGNQDLFTASVSGVTSFLINKAGNTGIGTTNPTTKFQVKGTNNVFSVDTSNNWIELGQSSALNGKLVLNNATNANTITLQTGVTTGSYSLTLPTAQGTTNQCLALSNTSGTLTFRDCVSSSSANEVVPVGTIVATARVTEPDGWLFASGSAVSRTTYSELFAAIGTSFGAGNGSTTFNLPDLRGRVPVGADGTANRIWLHGDKLGNSGGEETHLLTASESGLPAHSHTYSATSDNINGNFQGGGSKSGVANTNEFAATTSTTGGDDASYAHNNMQPYQIVNWIIKATDTALGADLAETYYTNDDSIDAGTIVSMDTTLEAGVKKTTTAYEQNVMGIISTKPGLILSDDTNSGRPVHLALIGRVPIKVSSSNGPIIAGDPIVPSSIPGVGMKATKPGYIVGKALEEYDNTDPHAVGTITVFINKTWYDPEVFITDSGNVSIAKTADNTYAVTNNGETVARIGAFKEAIIGTLRTGIVNATQVSAESITIAGMSLREYILSVISQTANEPTIVSPIDGKLAVNVLSPIGDDPEISLNLDKSEVSVKNKAGQKVAGIDSEGNATFSGTLKTKRLETDDIELSEEALSKLKNKLQLNATQSAASITNITNIYSNSSHSASTLSPTPSSPDQIGVLSGPTPTATPSATPTPSTTRLSAEALAQDGAKVDGTLDIQSDYANMASMSGVLGYIPNFKSDFATFTKGLMSFGPSSLSDVSVAGQLSVNGTMILAENSINVLGADLEIQPLRQGNVSFMGGLVKIDTEGNMHVAGNATFAKNVIVSGLVEANFVSPIPGNDLVIQLRGTTQTNSEDQRRSAFVIADENGSAKFSVNNLGEVIASGSGTFRNLAADAFKIVRGAQADTSITETVATASAGTAVISKHQYERTIFSPYVKEDSLIYITPLSDTGGLSPYIARQTAEDKDQGSIGSFTIQIPTTTLKDIKVNWWIVN